MNKILVFIFLILSASPIHAANLTTVLGPIPDDPTGLTNKILEISLGLAGGCAFLLMLYGGFLFINSNGDPNKLQEATDVLMSAAAGLLLIIFSVFILQLIGKDILLIF